MTVVPLAPLAYLSLWGEGTRPLVSTLNSFHGGVVSNAALVPAGLNGIITVYSTGPTHLIIDINGYFVGEGSTAPGLGFYILYPCRLVDTRLFSTTGLGAPALAAGAVRGLPLFLGSCYLPLWSTVASLNATVVPLGPLAYLTLWPGSRPQPYVSTLNSFEGLINANAAIVEMSSGVVDAFATDNTHLVLDVNGFFGPTGNPGELRLHPVVPCRVADTRLDGARIPLQPSETRDVLVGGVCGTPTGARGYSLN
ncbi:MAG: hypothetical protein JNL62_02690, partial [Bryobacterales bacterium]|nr:hypothetical protein [Bryobacterales bacterium]